MVCGQEIWSTIVRGIVHKCTRTETSTPTANYKYFGNAFLLILPVGTCRAIYINLTIVRFAKSRFTFLCIISDKSANATIEISELVDIKYRGSYNRCRLNVFHIQSATLYHLRRIICSILWVIACIETNNLLSVFIIQIQLCAIRNIKYTAHSLQSLCAFGSNTHAPYLCTVGKDIGCTAIIHVQVDIEDSSNLIQFAILLI